MLTSSTKSTDANKKTPEKKKRLTPAEVSDIIRQKNIKTKTELYALVETQKLEGCNDLHIFVINRSSKKILELIETTWEIEKSHRDLARQKKMCIDILRECQQIALMAVIILGMLLQSIHFNAIKLMSKHSLEQ